jgi:hypothetical protein
LPGEYFFSFSFLFNYTVFLSISIFLLNTQFIYFSCLPIHLHYTTTHQVWFTGIIPPNLFPLLLLLMNIFLFMFSHLFLSRYWRRGHDCSQLGNCCILIGGVSINCDYFFSFSSPWVGEWNSDLSYMIIVNECVTVEPHNLSVCETALPGQACLNTVSSSIEKTEKNKFSNQKLVLRCLNPNEET